MSGADQAEAALRASYHEERQQIAMTEGSRLVLAAMLRDELPHAVEEGIRRVLTPDLAKQFAEAFVTVMKEQASVRVDTWAGGMVKGFVGKIWEHLWIVVFACAFAYYVGGFGAVAALIRWAVQQAVT